MLASVGGSSVLTIFSLQREKNLDDQKLWLITNSRPNPLSFHCALLYKSLERGRDEWGRWKNRFDFVVGSYCKKAKNIFAGRTV